ncbi:hypothetical protein L207DRAFT_520016 [Hyaloscypha variabilis F]|uniref:Wax synthase domain-containing protein n=1 Tax=Hyaloscypha variabilis (strain UAMH 11265 / GT02V1 / F) TaxID=1149755 RepID=A0A2J6QW71_HYAVF|nr:hypothetical protein L207DRAFT_520016 [Hyaloscypha variabilis F]
MAFPMSINPAITILLQLTTEILILGFTSPTSILRLATFPLQFTFWYLTFLNINDYIRPNWSQIVAALSFVFFVMNFLEMSLLRRWSFEAQGPTSHPPSANPLPRSNGKSSNNKPPKFSSSKIQDTFLNRLKFGWTSTFSVRDIATLHEQASIPPFSTSNPSYVPSRPTFLLQTLLRFAVTYLILDLIECLPPPPSAAPFAPALYPIFLRGRDVPGITIEEVATRIGTSFMVWVVTYCLISCVVAFLSLVSVGTGLTPVSSWRPLFGSFREAYTLRGFWGKSWHQLPRKPLNNPAIWVVENVLGLKKGLVARYLKITITFFLSGIIHQIGDLSSQLPLSSSSALQFFTIQALGIIFEDFIQQLYHLAGFKSGVFTKAVGFVWVVAFLLFWTSPGWFFPQVYVAAMRSEEERRAFRRLVPFTVLGRFMVT